MFAPSTHESANITRASARQTGPVRLPLIFTHAIYADGLMPSHPFRTYLEMFRRRAGFSRPEIGFLVGAMDGKNVSNHERLARYPKLHTALAYAVIFDVPVDHIYEGLAREIRDEMKARARGLTRKLGKTKQTKLTQKKIAALNRIVSGEGIIPPMP